MLANYQKTTAFSAHLFSAFSVLLFLFLHSFSYLTEFSFLDWFFVVVYFICIYVFGAVLNEKLLEFKLININNYLPQILSIYFLSLQQPTMQSFLLICAAFTILIVMLELFDLYNTSGQYITVFGLSSVMSITSLVSPSFISLIIFFFVIVFWVKTTNLKDVVAFLLGYVFPYFALFSLSYLLNDYYLIKQLAKQINFTWISIPKLTTYNEIFIAFFIYVNVYSFLKINTKKNTMVHKARLIFRVFSLYFILTPLLFFFNAKYTIIEFLPVLWGGIGAFLVSSYIIQIQKKWLQNLWLWMIVLSSVWYVIQL